MRRIRDESAAMKTAEEISDHLIATRLATAFASCVPIVESLRKKAAQPFQTKEWGRAVETAETIMKAAEEAPARKVAAATAGVIAVCIFAVEALFRAFG
jgi:hypothetical protein